MKISTSRFEYCELKLSDLSVIENISRDMAWNDTINILLDNRKEDIDKFSTPGLSMYSDIIREQSQILEKQGIEKKDFYLKIPKSLIPEEYWHINFAMLKPDFRKSSLEFINRAIKRKEEKQRNGYWFSIKDKQSGKIIGATMLSTKVLYKNSLPIIGHSGQFIHPSMQRKGIISETKAVMVDFMYKYLLDNQQKEIPQNTKFYTTCDVLNRGSKSLQKKSGAVCINPDKPEGHKLLFLASREEITSSSLLLQHNISWSAELEDGSHFYSSTNPKLALTLKNGKMQQCIDF